MTVQQEEDNKVDITSKSCPGLQIIFYRPKETFVFGTDCCKIISQLQQP